MDNKKIILGSLTAIAGLSFIGSLENEVLAYNSVIENSYFEYDLKNAIDKQFITTEALGSPTVTMTRAEFASLVYNALGSNVTGSSTFKDVPKNHPYYKEIVAAANLGIITGHTDGTFKPDEKISREEMAIMIVRYFDKTNFTYSNSTNTGKFLDEADMAYPYVVQTLRDANVVAGYYDNTYKPKNKISKDEAIALFMRAENLNSIEKINLDSEGVVTGDINVRYSPAFSSTGFGVIKTGERINYSVLNENWYIVNFDGQIGYVYSPYVKNENEVNDGVEEKEFIGIGYAKELVNIYDEKGVAVTYVATGTALYVTKTDSAMNRAYIETGKFKGYVSLNQLNIVLSPMIKDRNYFTLNSAGEVTNNIYNYSTGKYSAIVIGKNNDALNLSSGTKYFSNKNFSINNSEVYPYYNYLPLRTKSNVTAAEIDAYIKANSPNSPLIGLGATFIDAANRNNINALYFVSNALHESNYGLSTIAKDKKNLFGFKAYDASAYDSAANFSTFEEGIYFCAEFISSNYLNPTSWRYNGAVTGDKSVGMNVKYASDLDWGAKIASHMYRIDKTFGFKDLGKYIYGELEKGVQLYNSNGSNLKVLDKNRIVAIQATVNIGGKEYYKIIADETNIEYFYVLKSDLNVYKTF